MLLRCRRHHSSVALTCAKLGARVSLFKSSELSSWTMSKHFRPWSIDQTLLLPLNVRDFVPKDHVSRFIVGLVRESLDLKAIMGSYVRWAGQPPFDPRMMVSLLLHGYERAVFVARRMREPAASGTIRDDCRARSATSERSATSASAI